MYRLIALTFALAIAGCATTNSTTPTAKERFEVELVALNIQGQTRHIKYDKYSGEAWWASDTSWSKIQESEVLPQSVYEIKAVASGDSWRAIRVDKVSGRTWKKSSGKWVSFTTQVQQ